MGNKQGKETPAAHGQPRNQAAATHTSKRNTHDQDNQIRHTHALHAATTHITQTHTDKTQNTTTLVTHHRQNKHSSTGTHATGTPQHRRPGREVNTLQASSASKVVEGDPAAP